ncbi:MAG: hypothetical protein JJU11_11915 [Candidatus Sumerlaeia bacterium]|nr:hypothetical protein [Candidatus Sumerlaeia bacterium]
MRKVLLMLAAGLAIQAPALAFDPLEQGCPCGMVHEWEPLFEMPEKCSLTEEEALALHGPVKAGSDDLSKHVDSVDKAPISITGPVNEVTGSLSGRIVYLMAGHGWTYDAPGVWYTQRPLTNLMVEDFGTIDQSTIMADMLLNAGATVVPMRPFGFRAEEVVMTNLHPNVTFAGTWNPSTQTPYYGNASDSVHYRWISAVDGEPTATATYDASTLITEAGYWPVYTWTRWGTDRINQEYIVGHSGGTTSMRINHQRVGSGWVYLGSYWFEPGEQAFVQITNSRLSGAPGSNAFADSIRWGNGMGDSRAEGSASGKPRHEENARYWLAESRGQSSGILLTNSVNAPPRLASQMNFEGGVDSGEVSDRLYLSFHSNAGGGRGADGLFNSNSGTPCSSPSSANSLNTPFGVSFAMEIGSRINTDMRTITTAPGNPFEHTWGKTAASNHIFGSGCGPNGGFSAYGEINNNNFGGQMTAGLLETAYHDNAMDAQLMRDPKVREALARYSVHAIINHFANHGGGPTVYPPETPVNPWVVTDNSGSVTLNWTPSQENGPWGAGGDLPTGYIIEVSENGRGFTSVEFLSGATTSNFNITPHVPAGETRHFRVVATNDGGQSHPSGVVSVRRQSGRADALIINGFERYDRTTNYRQVEPAYLGSPSAGGGTIHRVVPRFNNSFDYSVEVGESLAAHGVTFDTVQNDQVIDSSVQLGDYNAVYWILGEESTVNVTFNATEQTLVENYLAGGGHLFLSGAEVAWDLGRTAASSSNKAFLQNTLKTQPFTSGNPEDNAQTYTAQGVPGGIFDGIGSFNFSDGSDIHGKYDVAFPDVLVPTGGATVAMQYVGGYSPNLSAAIVHPGDDNRGALVYLGFPFETILDANLRDDVMGAVVTYFAEATQVGDWMDMVD